jgi:MoaA/NifB/PqqE/SkfB family radical SAM enzyme
MVKDLCFEIIESCPNNCKFCSSNSCIDKDKIICFDDFKRVVDYFIVNGGIEEISLSGGEPFLHPDIFKIVEYVKSKEIRLVIFTSGVIKKEEINETDKKYLINKMNEQINKVLDNEPWNDRLVNQIKRYYMQYIEPIGYTNISKKTLLYLKNMGLDKIVFDYQAYEAETDQYLMGRNGQSRQALLDSLLKASIIGFNVDVHFVPMKPNYKEIKDILEILEIAKVKNISFLNFVPQGRGRYNKLELQLSDNELKKFFEIVDDAKKYYSGNIRIGIPLQGENNHKCNAGLEKIDIKFDGTILPCPAFKELTKEECEKYNIKLYNIYDSLDQINIPGKGTRLEPLCRKIYKKE